VLETSAPAGLRGARTLLAAATRPPSLSLRVLRQGTLTESGRLLRLAHFYELYLVQGKHEVFLHAQSLSPSPIVPYPDVNVKRDITGVTVLHGNACYAASLIATDPHVSSRIVDLHTRQYTLLDECLLRTQSADSCCIHPSASLYPVPLLW
jgi:hypothetical protein